MTGLATPKASIVPPTVQAPGVFHKRVGDITLSILNDGEVSTSVLPLNGIGPAAISAVRGASEWITVNCIAVHSGGRLALIDAGANNLRPTTGLLMRNMAVAGLGPGDFDTVLLTHMHPDHVGWLIDEDGKALFPSCKVVMSEVEHAFWADERNRSRVSRRDPPWHDQNIAVLNAYRGRIETFEAGEVFPGVSAIPLPGHTPGHTGYEINSGQHSAVTWGDLVQNHTLQLRFPAAEVAYDIDPPLAVKSRIDLFKRLVSEPGLLVAGHHLPFPSFFRLAEADVGFDLIAEPWSPYVR